MIVFFDTSVHIALLGGTLSAETVFERLEVSGPLRMSPVVASELLRGVHEKKALRKIEDLLAGFAPIEPPSWRACWLEAGRLLPKAFPNYEQVGLARLQNDALIALTARHTGAVLVSFDTHFETFQRVLGFGLAILRDA